MTGKLRRLIPAVLFAAAVLLFSTAAVQGQTRNNGPQISAHTPPPILLGTAWYPEQWPESRWKTDLDLMQKAHIHVVRVAEFAWSTMEPSEGIYRFDWLEKAIDEAGRHGIYTVIGTPTAAPPAWLTQKYPETLRVDENGRRAEHGNRQQFNFDNPKYREFCRDIASRLAKHFGHNPYVIGWQIDNEMGVASYGPDTRADFDHWLKNYYGTLDNLNERWTTAYWSQTYSNWDQIPIETEPGNPGLLLSWRRFVSDTWRSYQKNQIDAIREYAAPRQFITTNMITSHGDYDYAMVAQDLNLASFDDYVHEGHMNPYKNGAAVDTVRGWLRKNFWIMETQPGHAYWGAVNNDLNKGEVRALAWSNVGHGADAVLYWQWRSALNGQEQYHGTLLGADGTPLPIYTEIAQVGQEFMKAGPVLAGTSPRSQVAILHSYPSVWAIDWQRDNENFDPLQQLLSYYAPLHDLAQSVDIVSPTDDLSQYKLVVAPGLNILTPAITKNLIQYVKNGGNLILGQRSGMKTIDNALQPERQPGPLVPLLGGRVIAYYALLHPVPVSGKFGNDTSRLWAETLDVQSPETRVLETYGKSNGWLDGKPAIITRKVGKGSITYVGVWMDKAGMKKLVRWALDESDVQPAFGPVPEGVEVNPRYGKGHTVFILVNLAKTQESVKLPASMQDVLEGGTVDSVSLPQYGVAVLSVRCIGKSSGPGCSVRH